MDLAPYRSVLARKGVARLLGFSVIARIPLAAVSVVMTLHVVIGLDRSYGAAGLVAAILTAGNAVGAPWRGRAVDRLGLRRALVPSIVVEGLFWCTAPFLPYQALLVTVFFGGLLGLPIYSVIRQSLAAMVPVRDQRAAYALDSMAVEVTFMIGPALGVLVATKGSTDLALLAVGVTTVLAGLLLTVLNPPVRTPDEPEPAIAPEPPPVPAAVVPPSEGPATPGAWWRPTWIGPQVGLVLAITFGSLLVLGGTDVAVVAHLRAHDAVGLASLVFFAWSASSLLGGLVFGAVQRPVSPSWLLLAMAVCSVPIGLAPSALWLTLAIVPAGLLCAPVLSATAAAVSALVPEEVRGEAMGWYGSAMTIGMALGAPLAGAAADRLGEWGGFAAVGAAGIVIAVVALLTPWTPGPVVTDRDRRSGEDRRTVPVGARD